MSRSKILIVLMSQPEREVIYAETGPTFGLEEITLLVG
jgi:hypothetical protein